MMILLFITVSKKSYGIVDKNILCRIKNILSYKLVFCVQYFLIFTVSCSSCHSLTSVSRTLSCCIDNCLNKKNNTHTRLTFLPLFLICKIFGTRYPDLIRNRLNTRYPVKNCTQYIPNLVWTSTRGRGSGPCGQEGGGSKT